MDLSLPSIPTGTVSSSGPLFISPDLDFSDQTSASFTDASSDLVFNVFSLDPEGGERTSCCLREQTRSLLANATPIFLCCRFTCSWILFSIVRKIINVVVFPSRTVAIENSLRLFSPRLAIVDEHLTKNLPRNWMTSLSIESKNSDQQIKDVVTVIDAPRQSDLMVELIKKLKPQVVVSGLASFEAVTSAAFELLLEITREIGARLFLDISDHFELSSLPSSNGVLKYLARNKLPPHVSIICALLKNQVYKDLEVAFVISEEDYILKALSSTVELLEGNTAPINQYYYGCLFHELLAFQLADRRPTAQH